MTYVSLCLNRTFMELKPKRKYQGLEPLTVLIVPLWN